MKRMEMRVNLVVAAAAVIVVGCGAGTPSPAEGPATTSPAPPSTTAPTAAAQATPGVSVAMPSPGGTVGSAVTVLADLPLREQPDAASDAAGTVPPGTNAWIAGAKLQGGGTWYQLVPLDPDPIGWTSGWAFGPDSDAALAPIELGCDSIGLSASLLASLSAGSKLACYSEPLTFAARIVDCNCDIDGGFVEPEWLGNSAVPGPDGTPVTALLIDENETTPPTSAEDWLLLHLDPSATAPEPLPFGEVLEVTGQFDHPSAALCVLPEGVEIGPADPVLFCRTNLAITGIN